MTAMEMTTTPEKSLILRLASGNIGAAVVLRKLLQAEGGMESLKALDACGIFGSRIWVLFQDVCCGDVRFIPELLRATDPEVCRKLLGPQNPDSEWKLYMDSVAGTLRKSQRSMGLAPLVNCVRSLHELVRLLEEPADARPGAMAEALGRAKVAIRELDDQWRQSAARGGAR